MAATFTARYGVGETRCRSRPDPPTDQGWALEWPRPQEESSRKRQFEYVERTARKAIEQMR